MGARKLRWTQSLSQLGTHSQRHGPVGYTASVGQLSGRQGGQGRGKNLEDPGTQPLPSLSEAYRPLAEEGSTIDTFPLIQSSSQLSTLHSTIQQSGSVPPNLPPHQSHTQGTLHCVGTNVRFSHGSKAHTHIATTGFLGSPLPSPPSIPFFIPGYRRVPNILDLHASSINSGPSICQEHKFKIEGRFCGVFSAPLPGM